MKKVMSFISLITLSFLLSSCNLNFEDNRSGEQVLIKQEISVYDYTDIDGEDVYKKVVKEEMFYVNPKRVVVYSLGVADIFNYLGLDLLDIQVFGLPKGGQPLPPSLKVFESKDYHDVGTLFIPDKNSLDLINPDLIILDSRTSNLYEELKKEYPNSDILDLSISIYSLEKQKENFSKLKLIFTSIGTRLDKVLNEFQKDFEMIKSFSQKHKALFMQITGKTIGVSNGKTGRFGLIYNEFGFLEADPNGNILTESSHGSTEVNALEYVSKVKPEVIFILDRNLIVSNEESDLEFLKDLKNFNVPAIDNDYIFFLDPYAWYTITGGIDSTYQTISDVQKFIEKIKS